MIQRHFVVADDLVVKVGDVEGVVGAELEIDGAEPRVLAGEEIGLFVRLRRGAGEGDVVVVHLRGDDIADEGVIVPFRPPHAAVDVNDAADASAAVRVLAHDGRKAEAIVRFAKAGITSAPNELVNRRTVAVGAVKIAVAVPREAEGIDLAAGVFFDSRTVGAETKHVAGMEFDTAARNVE